MTICIVVNVRIAAIVFRNLIEVRSFRLIRNRAELNQAVLVIRHIVLTEAACDNISIRVHFNNVECEVVSIQYSVILFLRLQNNFSILNICVRQFDFGRQMILVNHRRARLAHAQLVSGDLRTVCILFYCICIVRQSDNCYATILRYVYIL